MSISSRLFPGKIWVGCGLILLFLCPTRLLAGVRVDFFYSPGCRECDETREYVEQLAQEYGVELDIVPRDITVEENLELLWAWEEKTGRDTTEPTSLVIGGHFLNGEKEIRSGLEELLVSGAYLDEGSNEPSSSRGIRDEFAAFAPTAVLGAGLIDGINPCAFTVLIMLVSFLAVTGVSRRSVLQAGISFTSGVFLAYLLVGLGLAGVLLQGEKYRFIADIVYLVIGGLAIILGVISIRDGMVIKRTGDFASARLRLPDTLMRRIQKVLTGKLNPSRLLVSALVCGLLVSLLELVCTGQIYLPTIALIIREPDLRASAFIYLLLYCLAFIFPLICVFCLVYFGAGIPKLGELGAKYSWAVKLLTGLVFIGLGLFLFLSF